MGWQELGAAQPRQRAWRYVWCCDGLRLRPSAYRARWARRHLGVGAGNPHNKHHHGFHCHRWRAELHAGCRHPTRGADVLALGLGDRHCARHRPGRHALPPQPRLLHGLDDRFPQHDLPHELTGQARRHWKGHSLLERALGAYSSPGPHVASRLGWRCCCRTTGG